MIFFQSSPLIESSAAQCNDFGNEDDEADNQSGHGAHQDGGGPEVFDVTFPVIPFCLDKIGGAL